MTAFNQGNFESAVNRGAETLRVVQGKPAFSTMHTRTLQQMAWDLEAIQTAIRSEINDRMGGASGGMDLG